MIASFSSKALERFWTRGETRRVNPRHIAKLRKLLDALDAASQAEDMNRPSFGFHPLLGDQFGRYAVKVDRNWRVTFGWSEQGPDAVDVDYEDYH